MSDEKKLSERVRWIMFAFPHDEIKRNRVSELADEIAALEKRLEAINVVNKRDGSWMDKLGCCRVCDGEIPYGHTAECDYYKLEQRLEAAIDKVENQK